MSTNFEREMLKKYVKGLGINIGCGAKPIGGALNIDIDSHANAEIYADARALPFYPETMDFVVSSHCLEHIREAPLIIIREWLRVLKVGGVLAFIVPDGGDGTVSMGSSPGCFVPGRHVHVFTMEMLETLLRYAGAENIEIKRIDREEWSTKTIIAVCSKVRSVNCEVNPESLKAHYIWAKQIFQTIRWAKIKRIFRQMTV